MVVIAFIVWLFGAAVCVQQCKLLSSKAGVNRYLLTQKMIVNRWVDFW